MSNNSTATSSGVTLLTVVGVVFVVLKLVGVEPIAHWSWLWVLSPFWFTTALVLGLFLLFFVVGGLFRLVFE